MEGTDGGFAIKEEEMFVNQPRLSPRFLGDNGLRLRRLDGSSLEEAETMEDIVFIIYFIRHLLWIRFENIIQRAFGVYNWIGAVGFLIELQHLDVW